MSLSWSQEELELDLKHVSIESIFLVVNSSASHNLFRVDI